MEVFNFFIKILLYSLPSSFLMILSISATKNSLGLIPYLCFFLAIYISHYSVLELNHGSNLSKPRSLLIFLAILISFTIFFITHINVTVNSTNYYSHLFSALSSFLCIFLAIFVFGPKPLRHNVYLYLSIFLTSLAFFSFANIPAVFGTINNLYFSNGGYMRDYSPQYSVTLGLVDNIYDYVPITIFIISILFAPIFYIYSFSKSNSEIFSKISKLLFLLLICVLLYLLNFLFQNYLISYDTTDII